MTDFKIKAPDLTRRGALGAIGAAAALGVNRAHATPDTSASRLVLLGTGGGPILGGERAMMASAIMANGVPYLIDCGYGAAQGMARANIQIAQLGGVFITHHHGDHTLDLGPILFFTWLQGRTEALRLFGPPPLKAMTDHLLAANQVSIDLFRSGVGSAAMPAVDVNELTDARLVWADENVRVHCTTVIHPPVTPSFAYRFDMADRSIVFSGDTAVSDNLIALAQGADVLVHEAAEVQAIIAMMTQAGANAGEGDGVAPQGFDPQRFEAHVLGGHTSIAGAAQVAQAARVRTLVLSHVAPISSAAVPDDVWIREARRHFTGEIVVGHDGMTF